MKVLIVARCKQGRYAPFITEQVDALKEAGVECMYFGVIKRGIFGYLQHFRRLKNTINEFHPDIIHAHYGLCGLLANLQRQVPVVTTYHGSDINNPKVLPFSKLSIRESSYNIFVSQKICDIASPKDWYSIIPCGINLDDYPLIGKKEARRIMGLKTDEQYVLFSGSFENRVKNPQLARKAMTHIPEARLIELKGYSRSQVGVLLQAVDLLLVTSFNEGSPQVVKEALACCCPIVSVDVGDVKERIDGLNGCAICDNNEFSIACGINRILKSNKRTLGRQSIIDNKLDNASIASMIKDVYEKVYKR